MPRAAREAPVQLARVRLGEVGQRTPRVLASDDRHPTGEHDSRAHPG
jgi:hypothetical protein